MKETPLEVEIRQVLDAVVKHGSYTEGHMIWLMELTQRPKKDLQESLKKLLDIKGCYCD